jgi:hypothetical protein
MMERLAWYQDPRGDVSSMRIIAMMGAVIGGVVVLASLPAFYLGNPQAVGMAGIGAGLFGVGEIAKAWSRLAEKER